MKDLSLMTHAWRPMVVALVAATLAALPGCLEEPEIDERWTLLEMLSSDPTFGEDLDAGQPLNVRLAGRITYRAIRTGFLVAEVRYSDSLGPAWSFANGENPITSYFELVPATATIDLNFPGNDRIAVRSNTVAHVLIDQLGFPWTMHHDSADIVNALKRGEAEAGLIWGPEIAMTQTSYNLQFEAPSALRWNHHAVTRAADVALREAIDGILASVDVQEEIEDSMRRHGIPPRRPFVTVHRLEMIAQ